MRQISQLKCIPKQLFLCLLITAIPLTSNALDFTVNSGTLTLTGSGIDDWITVNGNGAGNLDVRMGKRANVLVGSYSNVTNLSVVAKKGNNKIHFNEVTVPGTVTVTARSGNDQVRFSGGFSAGGDLIVDLNGGNNTITTKAQASIYIGGSASFDANKGKDQIKLSSISTGGQLILDTAGGADIIKLGLNNQYTVNIGESLTVLGGRGKNNINIHGAAVSNTIQLMSGGDADSYTIKNTTAGDFFDLNSGGGRDRIVSKDNTVAGEYNIHCGSGIDKLSSKNITASTQLEQFCVN